MLKYLPGEKVKYNRNGDIGIIVNIDEPSIIEQTTIYAINRYKIKADFGEFWLNEHTLDALNQKRDQ